MLAAGTMRATIERVKDMLLTAVSDLALFIAIESASLLQRHKFNGELCD